MNKTTYKISTLGYGVVALLSTLAVINFSMQKEWFLTIICILIIGVALDNFFCSKRARKAGFKARKHYTWPKLK